ncbi:FxLYD domain-containing protein [Halostagnicola sp. A56]|uniref:FxLYD domain-containing protein n=1 Tax=Halostagnicola sp. A56 TaxID=1495067 RepID=UPI0012E2CF6E|nr:FxLYD domain-containing protein [Halostagnicola sp. A56]
MRRRSLLTSGAVIAISGCLSNETSDESDNSNNSPENESTSSVGYEENDEVHYIKVGETFEGYIDRGVQVSDIHWEEHPAISRAGVIGTVENTRNDEIADIDFSVDFYDGDTQIGSSWTMPRFLSNGEYAEIAVAPTHVNDPDRINRFGVTSTVRVDPLTPLNDDEVTVTNESANLKTSQPTVSGRVENTAGKELTRIYVHINFYDSNELVDWRRDGLSRLQAGDSGEWEVTASKHADSDRIQEYKRRVTVQLSR